MTREEFTQIMDGDSNLAKFKGTDKNLGGINLLAKYQPGYVIQGAGHDIIWLLDVDHALARGLTPEDAKELRDRNFFIDEECDSIACYV